MAFALFFGGALAQWASAEDFTPYELEDMVKSGFAGCMKTQLGLAANAGASRELIEEYCRCTANKLAARATRAEFDEMTRNNGLVTETLVVKAREIGLECREELAR